MKDILLIYRGQAFDREIKPKLEQYKNDNITLVVDNIITKRLVSFLIKKYNQKIYLISSDEFLDDTKILKFMKFDSILGNFPYEKSVGPSKSEPIWHLFVKKTLKMLKDGGHYQVIHPSAWRNAKSKFDIVKKLYLNKKITLLDLNDFNKGREVFGAGTNFDIIHLENIAPEIGFKTKIIDDSDNVHHICLSDVKFIPNSNFDKLLSLVANENEELVNILFDRSSYGNDKPNMSNEKNEEFKYPCVYTITKKDGINVRYSNVNKGHFDIPKVIWSNGLGTYPIIDAEGKYGVMNFSAAIIDEVSNLENIKKALTSESFLNLMKSVKFKNDIYDYRIISTFRKDFWKEFIND
jgi:hypothetical protein